MKSMKVVAAAAVLSFGGALALQASAADTHPPVTFTGVLVTDTVDVLCNQVSLSTSIGGRNLACTDGVTP